MPQDALDGLGYLLWTATGLGTPDWFGALLWATIWLVVVAMAAAVVVSGRWARGRKGVLSFGLGPVLPFGTFALAYLLFIVASLMRTGIAPGKNAPKNATWRNGSPRRASGWFAPTGMSILAEAS